MTKEEINKKTSLCFLLNPDVSEEEKNCVIEKVMTTKATIVPKAALCNIITYLLKQNAELKDKNCWKTCEYAEPKSQWISQHIQDVAQLSKAKELIEELSSSLSVVGECEEEECELLNRAEQFLINLERYENGK